MGLRDIGESLPPGFRFYPSDEELVCHYLYKKIANEQVLKGTLVEIDLHTCEPWQLPEVAKLNASEWYFFSFRDRKYATGFRTNRATSSGYWKATGKDRTVLDPITREIVGMRKTLVFYKNRAPNGIKSGWIMHEFRLESPHMPPKEDWVLCRVFYKSKAEDNSLKYNDSPPYMYETTTNTNTCPTTNNATSFHYNDHNTTSLNQTSLLNLLQIPHQEKLNTSISGNEVISLKGDGNVNDDYGFFWDNMNLDETSLVHDGVTSNTEDMRFEIDNSMIFL
ncbi:hypothetical protein ACFE04_031892 [Oxalis oulophora]